jgi:HAD superfamily hydrolase (TIGR01509 family)
MDYDGTLHDWDGVLKRALDGVLGLSGEEFYDTWTYEIHRGIIHTRYMERHDDTMFHCQLLFDHLDRPFDEETAELICKKFDEAVYQARNSPHYFPDAIPSLDRLNETGVILCLSTGTGAESKAETLEEFTGTRYFEHIFSEPKLGYFKTEPEYYRLALEEVGSKPHETVSIGDTPLSDIRPAKLVGIHTIWLNRDDEPRPTHPEQIADHEAATLTEALEVLESVL